MLGHRRERRIYQTLVVCVALHFLWSTVHGAETGGASWEMSGASFCRCPLGKRRGSRLRGWLRGGISWCEYSAVQAGSRLRRVWRRFADEQEMLASMA